MEISWKWLSSTVLVWYGPQLIEFDMVNDDADLIDDEVIHAAKFDDKDEKYESRNWDSPTSFIFNKLHVTIYCRLFYSEIDIFELVIKLLSYWNVTRLYCCNHSDFHIVTAIKNDLGVKGFIDLQLPV